MGITPNTHHELVELIRTNPDSAEAILRDQPEVYLRLLKEALGDITDGVDDTMVPIVKLCSLVNTGISDLTLRITELGKGGHYDDYASDVLYTILTTWFLPIIGPAFAALSDYAAGRTSLEDTLTIHERLITQVVASGTAALQHQHTEGE